MRLTRFALAREASIPSARVISATGLDKPIPLLDILELESSSNGPVSLPLSSGECVCILGSSGSGKSVLLRLIADLDPGAGTVRLQGELRDGIDAPAWRSKVIYQAAEPAWWAPSLIEHFASERIDQVLELMTRLGLDSTLLRVDVARLSTGERQRMALIRSLVRAPAVLLLDEPTASLDETSTLVMESLLLEQLKHGLGIVMVTHSREQAQRMSQRHFEMRSGQLYPR